jgi:serine/threonine protein kinase/Flp pilus assembly protein TadD/TolB-like protein
MSEDRPQRLSRLFLQVRDLPSGRRKDFLEVACGGDAQLRQDLESLLAQDPQAAETLTDKGLAADVADRDGDNPDASVRSSAESSIVGRRVAHYEILEEIGHGGMGVVYRARDLMLGRNVALKRVAPGHEADPQSYRRFMREAHTASQLFHPNIVPIFEVFEDAAEPWLAMQLVKGRDLRQVLAEKSPLSIREVLRYGVELAEALQAAHQAHIIHRDVNPKNIIISQEGHALLADFGLAGYFIPPEDASHASRQGSSLTKPGTQLGTPAYMSPEQTLGRSLDARSDLFSLGAVLYEMCTGKSAFFADSVGETLDLVLHREPVPIAKFNYEVPEELERIIRKAMAKNAEERYQESRDLLVDLKAFRRRYQHDSFEETHLPASGEQSRRLPRRFVVAIGLTTAVAILLAWATWQVFLGIPPGGQPHLAVASFKNLTGDAELHHLVQGCRETIMTKLAGLQGIYVIPTESDVDADLILEGSVQKVGDELRISFRLRDEKATRTLGGRVVRGKRERFLDLQDELVKGVVDILHAELGPSLQYTRSKNPTDDIVAYDLYLEGRDLLRSDDRPEHIDGAVELFNLALARDPSFAHAHARLCEAYWRTYQITRERQWIESAQASCMRAVGLQLDLAVGHAWLGKVHHDLGRYETATEDFLRAIEIDPTDEMAYRGLGRTQLALGKPNVAEEALRKAVRLHPEYWFGHAYLGGFYGRVARYTEAAVEYERAIELAPSNAPALLRLGGIYHFLGRDEDALAVLNRSIEIRPAFKALFNKGSVLASLHRFEEAIVVYERAARSEEADYLLYGNLARAYYWAGERAQAEATFERAIRMGEQRLGVNPRDADAHVMLAVYHAMLGRHEDAVERLEAALRSQPGNPEFLFWAGIIYNQHADAATALEWLVQAVRTGYSVSDIQTFPELDNLRQLPRFKALAAGRAASEDE